MIKSYFRSALRTITRNKLSSFIHVFGLGLAMTVGLMIMIRLQDDLSWDQFHPNSQLIYRITTEVKKADGTVYQMASSPIPLHADITQHSSQIKAAVNIYPVLNGLIQSDGREFNINGAYTDPSFFTVFGFEPEKGNITTALQQPNSIVLTRSTAEKLFGNAEPLGKLISTVSGQTFTVTAVLKEPPGKTHFPFEAYASMSSLSATNPIELSNWFAFQSSYNYVLLKDASAAASFRQHLNSTAAMLNRQQPGMHVAFHLQSFNDITPSQDRLLNEMGGASSWSKMLTECGVALLILLAACFNYTNLTIARALKKAKEIGIRKIIGASRAQVFLQCIAEAMLLSLLALLFAWLIVSFLVRYAPFNDGYEFIPSSFSYNSVIIVCSLAFAIFTGLLAGASPAWLLSSFTPLKVLRNFASLKIIGKAGLQKTLIVFQYSLSLVMIIFLVTFYRQFDHMAKLDPGFRLKDVVSISTSGNNNLVLQKEISSLSGITAVSLSTANPGAQFRGAAGNAWHHEKQSSFTLKYIYADADFIPLMQLKILAGKNFTPSAGNDIETVVVINEQAAKAMGFQDPDAAIGQPLHVNDSLRLNVCGVIKDFYFEGTGRAVTPLALRFNPGSANTLFAVASPKTNRQQLKAAVEAVWKKTGVASQPFRINWLDEEYTRNYSQGATISLLAYLCFIAVVIATLGLLGIVIHTIETRKKEITIRKIIGADRKQLISILSSGFVRLLFIAGLIAMPLGYMLGYMFLFNFAERVNFGFLNVVFCFLFLLGAGLFTIIPQTWAAAGSDPVEGLRSE
ncbi:ABC transporter permease [Pseudobacter ginsenosidimutans]|uniref:Putative ABC transport system permease protein n=1 Tax=Pseudobacter ginsenosidimutans TaxID=661488 RepID=A0A4V2F272_9BACT|nr:ABC transporter permease [Pseudobacter ginsenosidimutans]QEC44780.1 FtsX-like permease family protein [Pseudobacter ginsenosidimutans]RZS76267.1 putative ABC transport system permease protein [Pseudobacter ginsenosidimutans]